MAHVSAKFSAFSVFSAESQGNKSTIMLKIIFRMKGRLFEEQKIHLEVSSRPNYNIYIGKSQAQPDGKYVIYFYLIPRPLHIERAEGEEKEQ